MNPTTTSPLRRSTEPANQLVLDGSPVVYGVVTRVNTPYGAFDEMIAPGALRTALSGDYGADVALVRDHLPSLLLGRVRSGTLVLRDTPTYLAMTARLPDTPLGNETWNLTNRGDLSGMSFSFVVGSDGFTWHEQKGDVPLRVVRDVERLFDVSVVTWPAYPQTSLMARSSARRSTNDHRRHLLALMGDTSLPPVGRSASPGHDLELWSARRPCRVAGHPGADMRSALALAKVSGQQRPL